MGGADHRSFTALEGSGLPSDLRQQGKRSITVTEEDLAGPTQNHTRQSIFVYPEANFLFPSQKSAYRLLEGHRYELTAMLFFYSFFLRCSLCLRIHRRPSAPHQEQREFISFSVPHTPNTFYIHIYLFNLQELREYKSDSVLQLLFQFSTLPVFHIILQNCLHDFFS